MGWAGAIGRAELVHELVYEMEGLGRVGALVGVSGRPGSTWFTSGHDGPRDAKLIQ